MMLTCPTLAGLMHYNGVLAILCLLVFVVTPTTVLLFYHLKSFQQCLTRCRLDGQAGLHALVDAY